MPKTVKHVDTFLSFLVRCLLISTMVSIAGCGGCGDSGSSSSGASVVVPPPAPPTPMTPPTGPPGSWLIMVYLAGDNNLQELALTELNRMEAAADQSRNWWQIRSYRRRWTLRSVASENESLSEGGIADSRGLARTNEA